jgi:UDP-N-acetylmuramate-alanine ligase
MPKGPLKPKASEIRRTIRAVRQEREHVERVVVDFQTGNFAVVIARGDKPPRPEIDVMREVEEILAAEHAQGEAA